MRRAFIVSPRERFRSGLAQTFRRRMSSGCRRLRASTVRQQDSHHRRQNRARHLGKVFCRQTFRTSRKETRHCSVSVDIVHNYVRRKHQFKTPKRAGVFRSLFLHWLIHLSSNLCFCSEMSPRNSSQPNTNQVFEIHALPCVNGRDCSHTCSVRISKGPHHAKA